MSDKISNGKDSREVIVIYVTLNIWRDIKGRLVEENCTYDT